MATMYNIRDLTSSFKMFIEITSIKIIATGGYDMLHLNTTLPEGIFPYDGNQILSLAVAKNKGEIYCMDNFPDVPYKIVNVRYDGSK